MPPNPWNDEKTAALIRLVREGLSGGLIASRLGVTRNSVIGKVTRMGLHLGSGHHPNKLYGSNPRNLRSTPFNSRNKPKVSHKPVFEKAPIPQQRAEDIARKSFSELSENDCRYPIGDPLSPDFGFCALEKMPGSPYCSGHHAVAYAGLPPKKPKAPSQNRETIRVKIDA